MKKSNALMLSYIVFLAITVAAYVICDWNGLERIALAATIAGCFFAFSDLANWYVSSNLLHAEAAREKILSHCNFWKAILKSSQKQIDEAKESLELLQPYTERNDHITQIIQDSMILLSQFEENTEKTKKSYAECQDWLKTMDNTIHKIKAKETTEVILAIYGFISFFILIAFDQVMIYCQPYSSVITVIAFLIIVLTYYLRDRLDESVKRTKESVSKYISEQERHISELNSNLEVFPILDAAKKLIDKIENQQSEADDNG